MRIVFKIIPCSRNKELEMLFECTWNVKPIYREEWKKNNKKTTLSEGGNSTKSMSFPI